MDNPLLFSFIYIIAFEVQDFVMTLVIFATVDYIIRRIVKLYYVSMQDLSQTMIHFKHLSCFFDYDNNDYYSNLSLFWEINHYT